MEIRRGIGVSPGYATEEVLILDTEQFYIPKRQIAPAQIQAECERVAVAVAAAKEEILDVQKKFSGLVGEETAAIFDAHMWMIEDNKILDEIAEMIREQKLTAEYSVSRVFRRYMKIFSEMKEGYLRQRVADIADNETRLLRHLLGRRRQTLSNLDKRVIVVAHDVTPSQTAMFNRDLVAGIATDLGGPTSHAAIMAKALQIPCIVGLKDLSTHLSGGDIVSLDGHQGLVVVSPDEGTKASFRKKAEKYKASEMALVQEQIHLKAETSDHELVRLHLNIESANELDLPVAAGHPVGLYRTEYLYLNRREPPGEEEHFESYMNCLQKLGGRSLTVRTLDLGGDKLFAAADLPVERNPILGCRSIRLSFAEPAVFRCQLRACLRAAAHGDLRVMFPLVASIEELRKAKQFLVDVGQELAEEGVPHSPKIKVGMMVEVPSAALLIDHFVRELDFVSIGSNDLLQYTLAVDRTNEKVAGLYKPSHPALLRLIHNVIQVGNKAGCEVSLCGEMAGDLRFVELLLGMGLRVFSVIPGLIPEVQKIIRSVSVKNAAVLVEQVMAMDDSEKIYALLETRARTIIPFAL
ncbi:MAG: phosphoenolpyruvate--protein phosphotransferase [Planctomycetota bacterium]